MLSTQISKMNEDGFSRCEERRQITDPGKNATPSQKADTAMQEHIYHAMWKDHVLWAIEYDEIDVYVKNKVVYLNGHIVSIASQSRIDNAIRGIPGILGIKNNLVLDDKLTLEVAAALGKLEHTYDCKFFTGVSHGVVSLNGVVNHENVKLLAEKCAASNANVRGVINNVRILSGAGLVQFDQPWLQPIIGEIIYFLDGISGIVRQVIINSNNRRVVAMTLQGRFADEGYGLDGMMDGKAQLPERLIAVPMNVVHHLTKASGFLSISGREKKGYVEFDPTHFIIPKKDWKAPYPYCSNDVLFPVEQQEIGNQILQQFLRSSFVVALEDQLLTEQLTANDSLGG
jgi:osmotically-inducible protein OsmY